MARAAEWAAANPERARAKQKELQAKNPERYARYRREWYERNIEQARAASKKWKRSPNGRKSARRTARIAFDRKREWLDSHKVGKPCADCGLYWPPFVLDFDHVRGEKVFTIGNWMAGQGQGVGG